MVQFYFLAVCFNLLGGFILAAPHFSERFPSLPVFREFVYSKKGIRIGLITSLFLIGVFKIISVSKGDIIIVGDLLPSLTLIASGLALLIEYINSDNDEVAAKGFLKKMDNIFVKHSSIIGVAAVIAACLHFLFPVVPFL